MSEPEVTYMEPHDAGNVQMPEEMETSKDVNQNIDTLSYQEKVQFIDNEVQSLLQFCISKGLTDKELNLCVKSFTGETSSAAQRFYKTNSRFFLVVAFLTVVGAVAIGFEPVNTQLNVHARLAFLKILPYWDWSSIYDEECMVSNPFLEEKVYSEEDCKPCLELNKKGVEKVQKAKTDEIRADFLTAGYPAHILDATKNWPGLGNFSVKNLIELYRTHKELKNQSDCSLISLPPMDAVVPRVFDDYETKASTSRPSYLLIENCHPKAAKVVRRFYGRPYFMPQSVVMSSSNKIFMAVGKMDINSEEDELRFEGDNRRYGTWMTVTTGQVTAKLYPRDECDIFGCKNITSVIKSGEALLVPHDIYSFVLVPSAKGDTVAVMSSLSWDDV